MRFPLLLASLLSTWPFATLCSAADEAPVSWKVGTPIVTYFAGPGFQGGAELNDTSARQLKDGGWNLVWCREKELEVLPRHGLRGQLTDPLLTPASLDQPEKRAALDALIGRVRTSPGLFAYFIADEPSTAAFPALGKLVAYLRELDPEHLAYINLFPAGATNEQLGTTGTVTTAYQEHLRQYVETVHPQLLSYDQYQFRNGGDTGGYFLNLALVREKALATGLPFLNIVQACSWQPDKPTEPMAPRVPTPEQMRYLVYTTLAYGAQGISYYVYSFPGHVGGMALADGTPTPLYHALQGFNREFVAIAGELQPLQSLGVYHAGMLPPGTVPVPADFPFTISPASPETKWEEMKPVQGVVLGSFGKVTDGKGAVSHLVVANLDYQAGKKVSLNVPGPVELLDAQAGTWAPIEGQHVDLDMPPGSGKLLRLRR